MAVVATAHVYKTCKRNMKIRHFPENQSSESNSVKQTRKMKTRLKCFVDFFSSSSFVWFRSSLSFSVAYLSFFVSLAYSHFWLCEWILFFGMCAFAVNVLFLMVIKIIIMMMMKVTYATTH